MAKGKIIRRGRNTIDLSIGIPPSKKRLYWDGSALPSVDFVAPTNAEVLQGPTLANSSKSTSKSVLPEGLGKGMAVVAGIGDIISAGVGNSQINEDPYAKSELSRVQNYNPSYLDYDSLMEGYTDYSYAEANKTKKDYMQGTGDYLKRTASATASGAAAGSAAGPWGALIGGLVGLGSGVAGWISSGSKARREARRYNAEANEANNMVRAGFINNRNNIAANATNDYLRTYAAYGGPLSTNGADFTNGLTSVDRGGVHESNPLDGVPMGESPDGVPNLVEEGEIMFNNYVFSNRLSPSKKVLEALHLPKKYENHTYAYIAEKLGKESEERPNDPISKRGLLDSMMRLMLAQENTRQSMKKPKGHKFASGGWAELLRYAPAVESGIETLTDSAGWTNKPEYRNAERIESAANNIREVSAPQLGDYLSYNPFDREYFSNQLAAQSAATRRGARDLAGLNRGTAVSSLLAADYNSGIGLGNLYRQGLEYNQAQREKVANFNRDTRKANAEAILNAGKANQSRDAEVAKYLTTAANLREDIYRLTEGNKSANITNLADNLGRIGKEATINNMIDRSPWLLYDHYQRYKAANDDNKEAYGGFLTINNRKKRR